MSRSSRTRRLRAWAALAALLAAGTMGVAALACSAIVGVEDVTLLRTKDAGSQSVDEEAATDDDAQVELDGSTPIEPSVQLAAGYLHTCARQKSGKVQCWGDNGAGQLGDGIPFGGTRDPATVPQDVNGLTDAIALASGVSHSCAIRRGGAVVCWGINSFGQLGDGTVTRSSSPVVVQGVSKAIAIAAGTSFTCALIEGGTVQCWGANYAGQLGDGTKVDRPTAAPVQQVTGATGIATAEYHACAVVAGAVTCWGKNTDGQLGNGSTAESLLPSPILSLGDIVQVVAASRFTCARATSGQVNCWGANNLGQLGTGSPNDAPNPSPAVNTVSDAVDLWVGYEHGCAARRTGEVRCWGNAGNGQVGSGSVPDDASIPRPTAVVGLSRALAVSTGGDHSCATTESGAVLCWGANTLGQLGNGGTAKAYAAVPVTGYP